MAPAPTPHPLPGTRPAHPPTARRGNAAEADQRMRVTLVLPPWGSPVASSPAPWAQPERHHLTRAELARRNAPRADHVAEIAGFARRHGLTVVHVSRARHDVVLEGPVSAMNRAFGVDLRDFHHDGATYRSHEGHAHVPRELAGVVRSVLGLDGRPLNRVRAFQHGGGPGISPLRLAQHYAFPTRYTGAGQRIAVVALGGGYLEEDLAEYFENVLGVKPPTVLSVSVDGATNDPIPAKELAKMVRAYNDPKFSMADLSKKFGERFGAMVGTAETSMDVQVVGACAPGAHIDVYFAPNTSHGLYHALYAAAGMGTDEKNSDGTPHAGDPATVISVSWGWPEPDAGGGAAQAIDRALQQASAAGSLVCCASGDTGSLGAQGRTAAAVLFPASSVHVLACGGTRFEGEDLDEPEAEVAWNNDDRGVPQATGGGVSGAVPLPPWQRMARVPPRWTLNGSAWLDGGLRGPHEAGLVGRGVPDVAAYADQIPGYQLVMGGVQTSAGGTSAATPLWAGLAARVAQGLGRTVAWLPRVVYDPRVAATFRPVIKGDNKIGDSGAAWFQAGAGWNPCCGLGVPDGEKLLSSLRALFPPTG